MEVLYTPACGRWQAAREAVVRVAAAEHIPVSLSERVVRAQDEAEALRFPGSPTIRIDGRDLQAEFEVLDDYGLG